MFTFQEVLSQICETDSRGSAELLIMPPQISSPLPDRLEAGALQAATMCRYPLEWWMTAAAVNSPASELSCGAFAALTSSDLGLSCISITKPEELYARELSHPVRRALQLHNSRRAVGASAKEDQEDATAADKKPDSCSEASPIARGPSEAELMAAAFNEEERVLFSVWQAGT